MYGRGFSLLGADYRPQAPLAYFSNLQNRELDPRSDCG